MSDESIVAVYATMEQTEGAVRELDQGHYPIKQISIVAQKLETEKEVHGFITAGDIAVKGAGVGAWVSGPAWAGVNFEEKCMDLSTAQAAVTALKDENTLGAFGQAGGTNFQRVTHFAEMEQTASALKPLS